MCVYVYTTFEVSSIILRSFRQGVILPPPPPQNKLLKRPSKLGLKLRTENCELSLEIQFSKTFVESNFETTSTGRTFTD